MDSKIPIIAGVVVVAIIILFTQFYISNENQKQQIIEAKIQEIDNLIKQKQYDHAIDGYSDILEIDSENLLAHRGMGDINLLLGHDSISYDYHQMGSYIAEKNGISPIPFKIGMANALQLNNPHESINIYDDVLFIDRTNINALNGLSQSYLLIGELTEAQQYCTTSLELNSSNNPNAQIACANVLREMGNYNESLSIYQNVLENYPGHSMALFGLGFTLYEMRNYDKAIEVIQTGIQNEIYYDPEILMVLAESFEQLNDNDSANHYYEMTLEQMSTDHFKYDLILEKIQQKLE